MHNTGRFQKAEVYRNVRKNIVMSTHVSEKSPAQSQLDEFRDMISQYNAVARALAERKRMLADKISSERNVDKLRELELRKSTVEAERYEVLDDMRALISYVKEREKCQDKG